MQVDKGTKGWGILAIHMKARTGVGRGEKSLLSDATRLADLLLGISKGSLLR